MILQLAMINHNMSYTNNKIGVYKSYRCHILLITMIMTFILNSYYRHIPLLRIIYTFNMTSIWLEYDLRFVIYLWYARFMSIHCTWQVYEWYMTIYLSYTCHMTCIWQNMYVIWQCMSYDIHCHMTYIFCHIPVIWQVYDR